MRAYLALSAFIAALGCATPTAQQYMSGSQAMEAARKSYQQQIADELARGADLKSVRICQLEAETGSHIRMVTCRLLAEDPMGRLWNKELLDVERRSSQYQLMPNTKPP
jgi:hypothetical protein